MTVRLYEKHILDGEKSMSSYTSRIIGNTLPCSLRFSFSLAWYQCWYPWSWHDIQASLLLVPVVVHLLIPLFVRWYRNIKLSSFKLNRNHYSDWISMQERKTSSSDNESACRLISQYILWTVRWIAATPKRNFEVKTCKPANCVCHCQPYLSQQWTYQIIKSDLIQNTGMELPETYPG